MTEADPYRWMEADSTAVETWLLDHHARAETVLASSTRDALRTRLGQLADDASALVEIARVGTTVFFARREPGQVHATLWRHEDGGTSIAFDVAALEPAARLASWRVDGSGTAIAVNVAAAGAEIGTVRIVESGIARTDRIDGVHNEFQPSWLPDGSLLCTKIDPAATDYVMGMQLFRHTPDRDELVFAPESPAELPWAVTCAKSEWIAICVQGQAPGLRVYAARIAELAGAATPWREVLRHVDLVDDIQLAGNAIYGITSRDAPNRRVELLDLDTGARSIVVAESSANIEGIAVAGDALYVRDSLEGRARLRRISSGSSELLDVPDGRWVSRIASDSRSAGIVAVVDDWLRPSAVIAYDAATTRARPLPIAAITPPELERFVVDRLEVASHDGELIPLTVLRAKHLTLDGSHPALLEAYGGYGMSLTPAIEPVRLAWLERGGVYAIAHVRGGGEKGRAWHLAGKGANKPNAIRDYIACARALCERGYTRPRRIGATGLSMGGVVIGGALVAMPELFGAVAIHAGMLNPSRYLHGVNAEPQRPELGSPDDESGLRTLLAMDVYAQLRDDVRYPPVLLTVGLNDERVSPWMSAKVAARLGTANNPVFVRCDREGHGMTATSAQLARRLADTWAFFVERLT